MTMRNQPTARQVRLGAELRRLREAAGLSAKEVAGLLNSSSTHMSQIEAGSSGISEERLDFAGIIAGDLPGIEVVKSPAIIFTFA